MPRLFPTLCAGAILSIAVSSLSAAEPLGPMPADGPASPVPRLLGRLGDDDPLIRSDATQRLINLGEAARPLLRKALATASPQVRSQLDQVLVHVPWTRPGEPEEVSQALAGYADKDPESRCVQIDNSIAPLGSPAAPALLRILLNDPSPAVRWSAANAMIAPDIPIRLNLEDGDALARSVVDSFDDKATVSYLPWNENAPLLAMVGWLLRFSDPKRAEQLMVRATDLEIAYPSAFRAQSDFAFEWLADRWAVKKDYPAMIRLVREEAAHAAWDPDATLPVPPSVLKLFAVQADYGPLTGIGNDLRNYQDYLAHPEVVYALGQMLHRNQHDLAGDMLDSIAAAMNGWSIEAHCTTGAFLAQEHWDAIAEREMRWSISLSGGKYYPAYFLLSDIASWRDDDLACALNIEMGLKQMHAQGRMLNEQYAVHYDESAMEWHYLRAYRQAKDQTKTAEHLERLLEMDQDRQILLKDPGMAADIVPALQDAKRGDEADRIFDSAYAALMEKVTTTPTDPMAKNNLAWLCACSGKKLDEAVKFADQAVALDQEDAACLDTQAEAYFRVGRVKEALEIEKRALGFKPDDIYMARQVERYAAAVK